MGKTALDERECSLADHLLHTILGCSSQHFIAAGDAKGWPCRVSSNNKRGTIY